MTPARRIPGQGGKVHRGLTPEVARRIAAIVYRIAAVDAVAITDADHILAYTGHGCPYMRPGLPVQTDATRRVLRTGIPEAVEDKAAMHCPVPGCPCPVHSAVIAPLKAQGTVVGTVKLYRQEVGMSPPWLTRLALGMSELLSLHIELEEAERERELLVEARLEALVAQIRPHFLFNTLNTIIATSRRDPDQARELLVELARFLRYTLQEMGDRVSVARDLEVVDLYLRLEQARFGDRIQVRVEVDPDCLNQEIPVLTLEPLVENAVVHGLAAKEGPGRVVVRIRRRGRQMRIVVADDGVGIAPERLRRIFDGPASVGVGLANVHERLVRWWGDQAGLYVRSRPGRGTVVMARVPFYDGDRPGSTDAVFAEEDRDADSVNRR